MPIPLDRRTFLQLTGTAVLGLSSARGAARQTTADGQGLVTGQPEGAKAGMDVLANGGNAVDATVAAALTAGVVAVSHCGIGGYGGHMVIATPAGKVTAIDFNTAAPATAREDMFPLDDSGAVKGNVNTYGWLAAGVPGTLAGLQLALDKHGTQPLSKLLKPAVRLAREGFEVPRGLVAPLKGAAARFRNDPASARLFLKDGEPLAEGATFRNPDLADMLEKLAKDNSVQSFYRGDIARHIAAAFKKHSGLVTAADLAAYRALEVEPLSIEWRGSTIYSAPLTAGGLSVLQAIAALKALGWEKWDVKDAKTTHARLEALRIAWHDRLALLGDPHKVKVPVERLLSKEYAEQSAERIQTAVKQQKPVAASTDGRPADGTIHLSAVDGRGMMVALTLTHGGLFGACVTVDGLGLLLGHGMSRFDPRPKRPNSPGPGKRPLHNMCPTIVVQDGRPIVTLGARGGRRIPNTVFDVLVNLVGQGRPLPDSVQAPRMHTEGGLDLTLTPGWPETDQEYLKKVGYALKPGTGAVLNAIARDPKTGKLLSDAR